MLADFRRMPRRLTWTGYPDRHGEARARHLFPMVPVKHDDRPAPRPGRPRDGFFGHFGRVPGDGTIPVPGIPLSPRADRAIVLIARQFQSALPWIPQTRSSPLRSAASANMAGGLRTELGIILRHPLFGAVPGYRFRQALHRQAGPLDDGLTDRHRCVAVTARVPVKCIAVQ